jgi:hypothetical protein
MILKSAETNEVNEAFEQCKSVLGLKDGIKPFEVFAKLDDEVREKTAV